MTTITAPTPVSAVLRIPISLVDPGPNARGDLGDVTELAASLRGIGQQIPIVVAQTAEGRWRIVDGHRRHAAATRAGLPHLDAIVRQPADDVRRIVVQLAIQAGGRRFDPIAEARALHALMFEHNLTRERIAAYVGRSPGWVRDRISLVHLDDVETRAVESGQMTVREALLRIQARRTTYPGRRAVPEVTPTPRPRTTGADPKLTPGERRVLILIAQGMTSDEAAAAIGSSRLTVKRQLGAVYRALGARNAPHAVHIAHMAGLIPGDHGGRRRRGHRGRTVQPAPQDQGAAALALLTPARSPRAGHTARGPAPKDRPT